MIKTRSKLSLPDFNYETLGVSPLKQARTAQRTADPLPPTADNDEGDDDEGDRDRDVDSKHPKRSSATFGTPQERESKRVKRDPRERGAQTDRDTVRPNPADLDANPVASSSNSLVSRKPSSTVSLPPFATEQQPVEQTPRSQSVPVQDAFPVGPSHRTPRATAKSPSRLRGASFAKVDVPVTTTTTGDDDVVMASPRSDRTRPSSRSSRLPTEPPDAFIPTSPLTSAPPTPASIYSSSSDRDDAPDVSEMTTNTAPRPRTPSLPTTRPTPSVAAFDFCFSSSANTPSTPTPKRSIVSRMKPKGAKATTPTPSGSNERVSGISAVSESLSKRAKTPFPTASGSSSKKSEPRAVAVSEEDPHSSTPTSTPGQAATRVGKMQPVAARTSRSRSPSKRSIVLAGAIDMEVPLNDADEAESESTPTLRDKVRSHSPSALEDTTPRTSGQVDPASDTGRKLVSTSTVIEKPLQAVDENEKLLSTSTAGDPATVSPASDSLSKATTEKPKASKYTRAASEIPLGGRMTRSASLRQKENKKNIEASAATSTTAERGRSVTRAGPSGTRNGQLSTSTGTRSKTPAPLTRARSKTPGPSTASTSNLPHPPSQTEAPPQTNTAPPKTPARKRAMSLSSVTRPTLSSVAKTLPPTTPGKTPGKARAASRPPASTIGIASSSTSTSSTSSGPGMTRSNGATNLAFGRPPNSESAVSTSAGVKKLTTLSTLSLALQKLNTSARAKSVGVGLGELGRPNTSLGFTRDVDRGSDDEDEGPDRKGRVNGKGKEKEAASRNSKGKSKDDTHLGRPTTAASSSSSPSVVARIDRRNGSVEPDTDGPRGRQVKRAATVGPSAYVGVRQEHDKAQRTLMLPPPVPKRARESDTDDTDGEHEGGGRLTSSNDASKGADGQAGGERKRINVHSGMVAGVKRGRGRGTFVFGAGRGTTGASAGTSAKPTFGVARLPGIFGGARGAFRGIGGNRVMHRVSKQSSLPTVEGSPAKPSTGHADTDVVMADATEMAETEEEDPLARKDKGKGRALDESATTNSSRGFDLEAIRALVRDEVAAEDAAAAALADSDEEGDTGPTSPEKWRLNATRRASAASHLLSQSMSALPQTPVRAKSRVRTAKTIGGAGDRAFPQTSVSLPALGTAPGALGRAGGVGVRVSANTRGMAAAVAAAASSPASDVGADGEKGKGKEREKDVGAGVGTPDSEAKPRADTTTGRKLKILKDCRIFVDVRTDDGDDAGALFVDMLQNLGAKLLGRVSQSCTHIVFKNGLMSTISRYRAAAEPKPLVVGIAWVVECAEQAKRADETKFLISLTGVNVAGANKRRRSMLPKHLTDFGSGFETPGLGQTPTGEGSKDSSLEMASPASDDAAGNSSLESDLPPLERARRRHSSLFAAWGQGR